nr:hypothetical protein CFP56_34052 [Quercus suber]
MLNIRPLPSSIRVLLISIFFFLGNNGILLRQTIKYRATSTHFSPLQAKACSVFRSSLQHCLSESVQSVPNGAIILHKIKFLSFRN